MKIYIGCRVAVFGVELIKYVTALTLTKIIILLHYQTPHGSALSLTSIIILLHYQSTHGSALSQNQFHHFEL